MTSFRPTCTTCWTLRPAGSTICADCGTRLLDPLPPPPPNLTRERREPEPVTRLEEKSGTRYIVREVEGHRIRSRCQRPSFLSERRRESLSSCLSLLPSTPLDA